MVGWGLGEGEVGLVRGLVGSKGRGRCGDVNQD